MVERDGPRGSLLERACRGEPVERTPVWAMRQAGRWDPEFRKLRGDRSFYAFAGDPELAAAASLCPLRFGVDGIILFYDITTLAIAMGQSFSLVPARGPVPTRPIRTRAQVEDLASQPEEAAFRSVLATLELVRRELAGRLPIIGFAGAPYTLATYQIGTGRDLDKTRTFAREHPDVWRGLLDKTAQATVVFLRCLREAGIGIYQIFDSWAGDLDRPEYLEYAQPYHEQICADVGGLSIVFVKDCPYLDLQVRSGAGVVSLGTSHDLGEVLGKHPQLVFQGNVDHKLLVTGSPQDVQAAAQRAVAAGGGRRHVLNLDHGMDPRAQVANFSAFVEAATNP